MKIVILAAGQGSRLGGHDLPKPLTTLLDGKSIMQHQITSLERYFSREDILVVVGYHKEAIMEAMDDLLFVYSPNYALENTSKSLLRAIKKVREDLLWINGDVVFHPEILGKVVSLKRNSMVVTVGDVGEEEVKYISDASGKIKEVSKTVKHGQGEAVGINFFTADSLPILQEQLEACHDNDYFEKAIEKSIKKGLNVWTCPVERTLCTEIDFPEDLIHAQKLMETWS
ncbi:MAG: phosphocholine cytidylyltransferase family protein [Parachlamydiaceae bacterium]